ncbi:MAG: DUF4760 domain-containing protein [Bacteroidales bacterium]|nr:DUF4760 domain-containing protein [Bacteroidales bacterium]
MDTLRFTLKLKFLYLLVLLFAVFIVLFITLPNNKDLVIFSITVLGGLAAIYSAFFVALSIKQKVNHDRISGCFKFMERHSNIDLQKLKSYLLKNFNVNDVKPSEIFERIVVDEDLHTAVRTTLNLYEEISVAIQFEFVDEKAMYKLVNEVTIIYYNNFKKYITEFRERNNNPTIWIEFTKLATSWEQGIYLATKRKITQ